MAVSGADRDLRLQAPFGYPGSQNPPFASASKLSVPTS